MVRVKEISAPELKKLQRLEAGIKKLRVVVHGVGIASLFLGIVLPILQDRDISYVYLAVAMVAIGPVLLGIENWAFSTGRKIRHIQAHVW